MRTPNLGTASFIPVEPPSDPKEYGRYLRELEQRIAAAVQLLAAGHIDQINVAPAKPRTGDIRLCDGTNLDLGTGQGVYCYYGAAWHLLG